MKEHDLLIALYTAYSTKMRCHVCRITGDYYLAQDLVQETFLIAVFKENDLNNHRNQEGWLFKTLNYLLIKNLDLAYRKVEFPLSEDLPAPQVSDPVGDLKYSLPKELSRCECEILIMKFEKQWDYSTMAAATGLSESCCRQRVSRAVKHCRAILQSKNNTVL